MRIFFKFKANNDLAGFVFDGRQTSYIYFICRIFANTGSSSSVAVVVVKDIVAVNIIFISGVYAVGLIKITRSGVSNTEARGIFNNDPGEHQA